MPTVAVLTAGDHVPVIGGVLFELVGKTGGAEFWQTGTMLANVGVIRGLTVTFKTCGSAHCGAFGVKVYVPLAVLLTTAGDHVPVIPFGDVVANVGIGVAPEQIGGMAAKFGTSLGLTVTLST